MRATKLINDGCSAFIASVTVTPNPIKTVRDIEIIRDFPDVFPEELLGPPPIREIDFTTELIPGALPVSIPPYRMAPAELVELKKQLQELLDKGFIRPSVSP